MSSDVINGDGKHIWLVLVSFRQKAAWAHFHNTFLCPIRILGAVCLHLNVPWNCLDLFWYLSPRWPMEYKEIHEWETLSVKAPAFESCQLAAARTNFFIYFYCQVWDLYQISQQEANWVGDSSQTHSPSVDPRIDHFGCNVLFLPLLNLFIRWF